MNTRYNHRQSSRKNRSRRRRGSNLRQRRRYSFEGLEPRLTLSATFTNFGGDFDIVLHFGPGINQNATARQAAERAAEFWEAQFSDPITVDIDVELGLIVTDGTPFPPGAVASTLSAPALLSYHDVAERLKADASDGETIVQRLPNSSGQLTFNLPSAADERDEFQLFEVTDAGVSALNPGADTLGNPLMETTRANAKALGFTSIRGFASAYAPGVVIDAEFVFNAARSFDFDNSNGVSDGSFDFERILVHEINHALGFNSETRVLDIALAENDGVVEGIFPGPMDLFRLAPGEGANFDSAARVLNTGNNVPTQVFHDGRFDPAALQPAPGISSVLFGDIPLSTGRNLGDENAPSHWKNNVTTNVALGLMDPATLTGQSIAPQPIDVRVPALVGWDWKDSASALNDAAPTVTVRAATTTDRTPQLTGGVSDSAADVFVRLPAVHGVDSATLLIDGPPLLSNAFRLSNGAASQANIVRVDLVLPGEYHEAYFDTQGGGEVQDFLAGGSAAAAVGLLSPEVDSSNDADVRSRSKVLTMTFDDFEPGETLTWGIDIDGPFSLGGNDLIGGLVTVEFDNGISVSNVMTSVPGNLDASSATMTVDHYLPVTVSGGTWTLPGSALPALSEGAYEVETLVVDSSGAEATDGTSNELFVVMAAPIEVTSTADSGPGTLRQAIVDANSRTGPDIINFRIGSGPQTIRPASPLPGINDTTIIDATTQPGYAGSPLIELDGSLADVANGLRTTRDASGIVIRGLVINRFSGSGIRLLGDNAQVEGNYIGTNSAGSGSGTGNGVAGVNIGGGTGNVIGGSVSTGNVISRNAFGVQIVSGASHNIVAGNLIGTDVSGTRDRGNTDSGVSLGGGAAGNLIGGTSDGARNIISGNNGYGVKIVKTGNGENPVGNLVQGNYIGADINGTGILRNTVGVLVDNSTGNTVGGVAIGAGNVISGNVVGIRFTRAGEAAVQGNYIGTTSSGANPLPNRDGIELKDTDSEIVIGGAGERAGNVISGNNRDGVRIESSNNTIAGNLIGLGAAGNAPVSSDQQVGVHIRSGGSEKVNGNNVIGGVLGFGGNVISGNGTGVRILDDNNIVAGNFIGLDEDGLAAVPNGEGVVILGAADNTIGGLDPSRRNVISGNDEAGITITGVGSTGNLVASNYIGVNHIGISGLGNQVGVLVEAGGDPNSPNRIGAPRGLNAISGNENQGVLLESAAASNTVIENNAIGVAWNNSFIIPNTQGILVNGAADNVINDNIIRRNTFEGVKIDGPSATGNVLRANTINENRHGVRITNGGSNNTIDDNVIHANRNLDKISEGFGIWIQEGVNNRITRNDVTNNASRGINLGLPAGAGSNDDGDADVGANNLQNWPNIDAAFYDIDAQELQIFVRLFSGAAHTAYPVTIELFRADDGEEGNFPLPSFQFPSEQLAADGVIVRVRMIPPSVINVGDYITGTATDALGNTSQFTDLPRLVQAPLNLPGAAAAGDQVAMAPLAMDQLTPVVDVGLFTDAAHGDMNGDIGLVETEDNAFEDDNSFARLDAVLADW